MTGPVLKRPWAVVLDGDERGRYVREDDARDEALRAIGVRRREGKQGNLWVENVVTGERYALGNGGWFRLDRVTPRGLTPEERAAAAAPAPAPEPEREPVTDRTWAWQERADLQ